MATAAIHYSQHLARVYVWMCGGAAAALQAGAAEIAALDLPGCPGALVADLGAGFGMHAIPLARSGARVLAIDSSPMLLGTLDELRGDLPVRCIEADLLSFRSHLTEAPGAILCMGDTVTHLPELAAVESLVETAFSALPRGGVFVLTLRDYSVRLAGDCRFIPVRSDDARILTCFLEYTADAVIVHDILHDRNPDGWHTRVSHYRKLRLPPARLINRLEAVGFDVRREAGVGGMVRLVARKP
jgi:2-polyprenyl-3-methyl-5-hydroxy-6-metoxy-1,4-benzoquinol methylase